MVLANGLMLTLWALALSFTLYGTYLALKHAGTSPPHLDAPFRLYPVSILKPLKGAEPGLSENLESFFKLDHPAFELIFSVADPMDPAVRIAQRLIRQYPEVRAQLITGQIEAGINPKVNNLIKSYERANYDWILISDSNVRVQRDYLKRQVGHLDAGVGILTSIVSGSGQNGLGGELEAVYLNTFYARGMHLAAAANRPCVIGKSMLFRKSEANRFGGIRVLARYLAEDYMAGEAMRKLGLRVVMASDPIPQHIGTYSLGDFWARHVRWGRLRKAQAPITFLFEPLMGSMSSMVIGAIAMNRAFDLAPAQFILLHLGIWSLCDYLLIRSLRIKRRPMTAVAWFIRELLYLPLWLHIALGNTVQWRGKSLVVQAGGLLQE